MDEKEHSFINVGLNKSRDYKNSMIKSPVSIDTSMIDSSFNEMSEYIIRVKDPKYKEYIQNKYELIVKAFYKIDKDSNSYIDFDEMHAFLNEGLKVKRNLK